ncbi:MAG TPA: L-threonylcarbamoyladenylate synthase [Acidimicrobiales bacterium]|nr:L-threonylcarbamoyladenylate synthase [Acidimicrobiales bacterium]
MTGESRPGPTAMALQDAVAALQAGAVVAIPTDTVYGLAVDPSCPGSTETLFAVKGRPAGLDLPVLVGSRAQADALSAGGALPPTAARLAEIFWPGALTLVVPRRHGLDWALGDHADTIGLRCPDHEVARRLCTAVGPLATTSANPHGAPPYTEARAVARAFAGRVAVIVDGGRCARPPSTVVAVDAAGLRCLREGALSFADVVAAAAAG